MEFLKGKMLHRADGSQVAAESVLQNSTLLVFYFSAGWCQPCKPFTEILTECLREWQETQQPINVILVSADTTDNDFLAYVKTTNFMGLHFDDPAVDALSVHFNIPGMPYLVVVNRLGQIVSDTAKNDVTAKRAKCIQDWLDKERGGPKPSEASKEGADLAEVLSQAESTGSPTEEISKEKVERVSETKKKTSDGTESVTSEKKFPVPSKRASNAKN